MDNLVDFIRATNADIMLLQEVRSSEDTSLEPRLRTMQYFREIFDYPYDHFGAHYRDFDESDGQSYSGNAIFSKLPIESSKQNFFQASYTEEYRDVPGNYENAPAAIEHYTLHTESGVMHVCNIHGPVDLDGDHYGQPRKNMHRAIEDETKDVSPVILAGDTNAKASNEALKGFSNIQSVFGEELATTFNMRRKDHPGYGTAPVDAIFASSDVRVLEKDCPDVDVSDHRPLVATLEV